MDCLFQLSRIDDPCLPTQYNIQESLKQATKLQDNKITQISLCNLGIYQGRQRLATTLPDYHDTF